MNPAKLTPEDRAELCRRVDFPALLAADGVDVRRRGAALVCKLRDERTPSCHLYAPNTGRKGAAGWTWHDYGDGKNGDALGYLVDVRGLAFMDAARVLAERTGYWPECLRHAEKGRPGCPRNDFDGGGKGRDTPPAPRAPAVPTLDHDAQLEACAAFILELESLCPEAAAQGEAYLASRGCLPGGWPGGAWMLTEADLRKLAERLADGPRADLLTRAGLLTAPEGKPLRVFWWGRVCLLGCYDPAGCLAYLVARRMDWKPGDTVGKYLNQPCAGGGVRWPFNVPALYHAAGRLPAWPVKTTAEDVLLVEGALDALGAAVLGWPAVALLNRPQVHDYADRDGAAARMLDPHLPALRDVRRVRVVPDADPGDKGAEGEALAARLVGWLRAAGCRAAVALLSDLCPDAPEGCKDLADVAASMIQPKAEKESPAKPAAKGTRQRATADTVRGKGKGTP